MLDLKTGEIEEDKKRALREMMEKLADEIVQKKTALREKQLAEVRMLWSDVPNYNLDMMKSLKQKI